MTETPDNATSTAADAAIDGKVLYALRHSSAPATVDALAARTHLQSQELLASLDRLVAAGCMISRGPEGVSLSATGLGVWSDFIRATTGPDRVVEVYRQTSSTQDAARRLIAGIGAAGADRALIFADEQTAGRGRMGRSWTAPPGSAVLVSRVAKLNQRQMQSVECLPLIAAVAVVETIDLLAQGRSEPARIKWPNDVFVQRRKIAGILVEMMPREQVAIIGIGVNVGLRAEQLPAELKDKATSLAMLGIEGDRLSVAKTLVHQLDGWLAADADWDRAIRTWRARSLYRGDELVTFLHDNRRTTGYVVDVDPAAGLIVRTQTGELVNLPAATTSVVP